jgi:hypothetical protein
MATHLRIDGETWRLTASLDPEVVQSSIVRAMKGGEVIRILVETTDGRRDRTYLTISGRAVGQFALVEVEE